ncbi:nuclear transport factor 2 family protein [Nocardia transvalensis]|uniref:nuclear transport factor 2 family protein n=1 Tax=Nocardia transvalensis TaxID=37333 RepID=UPI0018960CDA|nr:nuclear transport factor 2 family protein [Nocardia transvalensis]MBF6327153.1 nuclear transport factor 2 family protein [Nocardia transvalensis]
MDRGAVEAWVGGYERAWRAAGTGQLRELFAEDVGYLVSPWAEPVRGMAALERLWEDKRAGPDEPFAMTSEVVAVDGDTAVVRVAVEYFADDPARWRDLWILRFDRDGRCVWFEEWPFAPGQPDGQ